MHRLLILFVLLIDYAVAQNPVSIGDVIPRNAFKLSPLHLLNFYPTVQLAYERALMKNYTVQVELGYVIPPVPKPRPWSNDPDSLFMNKRGVKLRLEPRYYFWMKNKRTVTAYYGAVEWYMNAISFDRSYSYFECLDRDCLTGETRYYDFTVQYSEQGFNLKLGFISYFSKTSDFFVDLNAGTAFRWINYKKPDYAKDHSVGEHFPYGHHPYESKRAIFSPVMGVRVGYRLN